ncbi:hypothetical protein F5Y18DRAFT_396824 [Xylariaceae sp. FL1019]|nr:hypothetical protein F5Y18DRAFT_396824 [Xylariaceae sp. FL1019]
MAELGEGSGQRPSFASIAEAATASWLAHRASTPNSRQGTKAQTPVPVAGGESKSASASASASLVIPTPTPPPASAPLRLPSSSTSVYLLSTKPPVETPVPVPVIPGSAPFAPGIPIPAPPSTTSSDIPSPGIPSSHSSSVVQGSGKPATQTDIRSDITAWESALQVLPEEFKGRELPTHPLTEALHKQPTVRPVEWNQYRQNGGFVPRTAHDFASLMIYLCGQVNPNPCRNCQLRNGPFSRCIVSPPQVLGVSFLRHACANCTYQNQYKRCTNDPITEAEKVRSDLLRTVVRPRQSVPKPTIAKRPKAPNRHKDSRDQIRQREIDNSRQEDHLYPAIRATGQNSEQPKMPNQHQTQPEARSVPVPLDQAPILTFDEKLQCLREVTPQRRRRLMAEATQWQAAIMTVEAEDAMPMSVPIPMPMPAPAPHGSATSNPKRQRMNSYGSTTHHHQGFAPLGSQTARETPNHAEPLGPPASVAIAQDRLRVPRQTQTPSRPAPIPYFPTSATTSFAQASSAGSGNANHEGDTTVEDESEEEPDDVGIFPGPGPYGEGDTEGTLQIKAPRY